MAGEKLEVVQRDDAWITVLTPLEPGDAGRSAEEPAADTPAVTPGHDEYLVTASPAKTKRRWSPWTILSLLILLGGIGATTFGSFAALDRYFPEIGDIRGVDGDPPAILAQPDEPSDRFTEYGNRALEWATSWPLVLIVPLATAALFGLFAGWVRWRLGRTRAAEARARRLEGEAMRLRANNAEQAERLGGLDQEILQARREVADLVGQLESNAQQHLSGQQLTSAVEAKTREVARLNVDLDDALTERDALESAVTELKALLDAGAEQNAKSAETAEKLEAAKDLVRQQKKKIFSLESHLDQLRRRTAEMAQDARSAQQLRSAWAQAEEVIADLSRQLGEVEDGRESYRPQTAESIVANNSRVTELEGLLNEAADVVEGLQEQLRQTRFQVSERDAALSRAEARTEAMQTEIDLLTSEIDQAAYVIASLQELPRQRRSDDSMLVDLRGALNAERKHSGELERQLRTVSARALRLEQRLIGERPSLDEVLDLTGSPSESPNPETSAA